MEVAMKLCRDFGVRALLAVLSAVIFGLAIGYPVWTRDIELLKVVAPIVSAPLMLAWSFYFASRGIQP